MVMWRGVPHTYQVCVWSLSLCRSVGARACGASPGQIVYMYTAFPSTLLFSTGDTAKEYFLAKKKQNDYFTMEKRNLGVKTSTAVITSV